MTQNITQKDIIHNYKIKRRIVLTIALFLMVILYTFKNTSILLRAGSTILFLTTFYLIDHSFRLHFKLEHYFYMIIIAILGVMLSPLYYIYPNYDKIQHFALPILVCIMVFFLVSRLQLDFKTKILFTCFIVLGICALFEIGEYLLDIFFDLKLQGVFLRNVVGLEKYDIILDRNDDTMIDLIFAVLGIISYATVKFLKKKIH